MLRATDRVVVGLGHSNVDYLGVVGHYPEPDTKTDVRTFSQQGGGPVATAIATLANFGVRTRFVGRVADDAFGHFIREGLSSLGVDLGHMRIDAGKVSAFSFIAVEEGSGRRTVFSTPGSVAKLSRDDFDPAWLACASMLLVDGHHVEAQVRAAEEARVRRIPVVLDAGSLREGMGDLVELSNVLVASERFATEVAPAAELEQTLAEMRRMGPETVVITLGAEGAIGLSGSKIVRVQALQVDVADTTGAGDVFHGAFAYGLLEGWDVARMMRFAAVAAGLKCRTLGGRAGLPSLEEVRKYL